MVDFKLEEEIEMYLSIYEDKYTEEELIFIRKNAKKFYREKIYIDVISQILVALGRHPESNNRYKKYVEFLQLKYGINQDILEVSCGKFPALSKYIDEEQRKCGNGSITAYDPKLVTTSYGNIRLYNKLFDQNIDFGKFSLITAIHPGEATIPIIKLANQNDKDFSILTCGCTHFSDRDNFFFTPQKLSEWYNYLFELAKENLSSDRIVEIDYIDGIKNPIISSRKKL